MKELISERPNIVPVGLGNNASDIDMSGYANGFNSDVGDESSQPAITEELERKTAEQVEMTLRSWNKTM
jgi:hypothetical protein